MTAEELMSRYAMEAHMENGSFRECHYKHSGPGRAASGSMYYYVAPGEFTQFHRIDCDEYWCFVQGAALKIFMIGEDGSLRSIKLGTEPGCEPLVYIKKGVIFASVSLAEGNEGSFLSCITVPRFSYEGFEMFDAAGLQKRYPGLKELMESDE